MRRSVFRKTDVEELNMIENMIVKGEVVAGNDIDSSLLLDVPVLQTETLSLGEELILRELSTPVGLSGFLQVTVRTHAGEAEDRSRQIYVK